MKKMLSILLSACSLSLFAQEQLMIDEASRAMSKGSQPSFLVEIPQTTLKDVEKDWLKYLNNGSKEKSTLTDGEYLQKGAVNKNISSNPFNVYSRLLETTAGVRVTIWLTKNDSVFISKESNNDQDLAAQKYLHDFAAQEYQQVVKVELKGEQDKQKDLEKDLSGFIKDEEKSAKKISANRRSIQRAKDAIATNNADIQNIANKIVDAKNMVANTISDANANKGAKKTLKDLEDQQNKEQKQNEKQGKDIDEWNKEIRDEQRNISDSKAKQAVKQADIEKQKQKIKDIQTKLDNIK